MKIWKRYLCFTTMKVFFFFLICIFLVFVLIDFSTQSTRFYSSVQPNFIELLAYYLAQFSKYFDIFIPLTFLLSILYVLSDMQNRNEIVSLYMAGISKKNFLVPLFFLGFILALSIFYNSEFLTPRSHQYISYFRKTYKKKENKKRHQVHVLALKNHTKLVYANKTQNLLQDVFWITPQKIWHMKNLDLQKHPPIGESIDIFSRNNEGILMKTASIPSKTFQKIIIAEKDPTELIPVEGRALSQLFSQLYENKFSSEDDKSDVLTEINYLFAIPFVPFIILMICGPISLRFSKHKSFYYLTALSLFGFVAFYTFLDASLILAENQAISPILAIWFPLGLLFFTSYWTYKKIA